MKCFRIDDDGEHSHYAAETEGKALTAYLEGGDGDYEAEGAKAREVTDEEMRETSVTIEDNDQYPDGTVTLKHLFDDEVAKSMDSTIQLCSSVF